MYVTRLTRPIALAVDLDTARSFLRVIGDYEDALIEHLILAATIELEEAAQIALLTHTIQVRIDYWPNPDRRLKLPIGPVLTPSPTVTVTANGEAIGAELIPGQRPTLLLADSPGTGDVTYTIQYQAGFGSDSASVPQDIHHALFDQVAVAYDTRGASPLASQAPRARGTAGLSTAMQRVIGRYRGVRA